MLIEGDTKASPGEMQRFARGQAQNARIQVEETGKARRIVFIGAWDHLGVSRNLESEIKALEMSARGDKVVFDLSQVTDLDTAGAWLVCRIWTAHEKAGVSVTIEGASQSNMALISRMPRDLRAPEAPVQEEAPLFSRLFTPIGQSMHDIWKDTVASMNILGSAVRGGQVRGDRSSVVSPAAFVSQLDHMGVRATPIIVLMSFLIGAIIAQQSAFQLRFFGAEIFVVDLVGILQLREVGVLLTAIMVAGRSGSAITAEIGSMKMREEIDALKVMGLNPIAVLVFPRLIALVIALPLLTIVANFSALFGAMLVAWSYSGISPVTFQQRLVEAVDMTTIVSGMLKAPFMALIIGIVASVEGMKVGGSAESLGRRVTSSVVKSIFVVILIDGLFAIFYASINF